jgi:16S rRNA (adenine1518-N6/adenine1519-N6)-dimethyltransferase
MSAHVARKRFGQHFLRDPNTVRRIIDAFAPQADDDILEIGPGDGALTRELASRVHRLHAIEIDRDLAAALERELAHRPNVVIRNADALDVEIGPLVQGGRQLRLIGNLPYNVSTPMLFHLLTQARYIRDMCFMLQKEVVERLTAVPGTKAYGRLSVMIQWRCRAQRLFRVPPGAFRPAPKVESMVVRLEPYAIPPVAVTDEPAFASVIAAAFGARRKTLRNALSGMISGEELHAAGIDPMRRGETLTLAEFAALGNTLVEKQARSK